MLDWRLVAVIAVTGEAQSGILAGLRVVEGSAFVAAPLGGMTLAQLGADVIRFDQIGGGLDRDRWPLAEDGQSLFWAGLNKGKRSIQLDLRAPAGRELAQALITAPGDDAGLFLTNFPARGWLAYDALRAAPRGPHHGRADRQPRRHQRGRLHGQPRDRLPVGDRPAQPRRAAQQRAARPGTWRWARSRRPGCSPPSGTATRTGEGTLVRLSLSDVAFAMVGNLGRIAEAQLGGRDQPKDGNYLYGAFGHDFETRDGRRVMVVALTRAPVGGAAGRDRHRRGVREHRAGDRPRPRAPRPAASARAT